MLKLEFEKNDIKVLSKILEQYSNYLGMETAMMNKQEYESEIKPQKELIKKLMQELKNA